MALFVIACTERKAEGPLAAAFKYDARQHRLLGGAFLAPRGLFEAGHDLVVLSAEHGFLAPTTTVADYDRRMDGSRAAELLGSDDQMAAFHAALDGHDEVVVYGPRLYRDVVRAFADAAGVEDVEELTGADRGCGDHYSALAGYLANLDEDA